MTRGRTIAWLLVLASAVVFMVSIVPMSRRIRTFNERAGFVSFHADLYDSRDIRVPGFPPATITDAEMPDGAHAVRLDLAGRATLIPVKRPAGLNVPSLSVYDEWLKVLRITEVVRDGAGNQQTKPGSERLLIVVRRTPEGYDPDSTGEVRRSEWVFDFYSLAASGDVTHTTQRWPRKSNYGDPEARLRREASGESGDPKRTASARYLLQFQPLTERTAEHFAAMHVIPKLNMPEYKFSDTAFRYEVLGWTLPGAMGSVLVFVGALVFAVGPRRGRQLVGNAGDRS